MFSNIEQADWTNYIPEQPKQFVNSVDKGEVWNLAERPLSPDRVRGFRK